MALADVAPYVDAASGGLLLLLGTALALLRPRDRSRLAFAGFSVLMGLGFVVVNLANIGSLSVDDALWQAAWFLMLPAGACLALTAVLSPRPLPRRDLRALVLPAAVALGVGVSLVFLPNGRTPGGIGVAGLSTGLLFAIPVSYTHLTLPTNREV